jgi:hypothetical protein
MALVFSAKMPVEYGANLVSDFDLGASCFGEQSFYCCFGVHRLCLIKNLTPFWASPVRKRVWALKVIVRCYYYDEGSFIVHKTFAFYMFE